MFDRYCELQAASADLVRLAHDENVALKAKVEELEQAVDVWKLGLKEAVKDRATAVKSLKEMNDGDSIVYVCLDGDGCIFNRKYLVLGRAGGRQAAQDLQAHVTKLIGDSSDASSSAEPSTQVVVNVFYNRYGLGKVLNELGIVSPEVFGNFVLGFNSGHTLFTMTDVGPQKEGADAKLRDLIRLYAKLPTCKLVLVGCTFDSGYSPTLQSLTTEGLGSKLALLKSYSEVAYAIKDLHMRTEEFEGLFESHKLSLGAIGKKPSRAEMKERGGIKKREEKFEGKGKGKFDKTKALKAQPAPIPGDDGFTQVVSPRKSGGSKDAAVVGGMGSGLKKLDSKKPLARQNPPPCNAFYLTSSCKRADCKYSHDYFLTGKQISMLRTDAKKSPCVDALKGKCKLSQTECLAGHYCPYGRQCRYGNTCRFSGPNMHDEVPTTISGDEDEDEEGEWSEEEQ